jgi:hypothetical protein
LEPKLLGESEHTCAALIGSDDALTDGRDGER